MLTRSGIFRVVFTSRNCIAGTDEGVIAEVGRLMSICRVNNPSCNLTGALLTNAAFFGQVLEGPPRDVETMFERIQCDTRHAHVSVIEAGPAPHRMFEGWMSAPAALGEEAALYKEAFRRCRGLAPDLPAGTPSADLIADLTRRMAQAPA